jgi:hypothetical protein
MFGTVSERIAFGRVQFLGSADVTGAWTIEPSRCASELSNTSGPVLLMGAAFSFVALLDYLAETRRPLRLPPGSRVLETGGYKGRTRVVPKEQLHALITRWLGIPRSSIVSEYGMCELSSQAYSSGAAGATPHDCFLFPAWARAQVISPETGLEVAEGETGLLRIADLANVYSVLAVQTADLAIRRGCGFELVGRAQEVEPRGCSLMVEALGASAPGLASVP